MLAAIGTVGASECGAAVVAVAVGFGMIGGHRGKMLPNVLSCKEVTHASDRNGNEVRSED